ncbi:MAG: GTP-binding protein, partial [Candidatus Vecturithrix sp.]|nr:GTP-binding protein [Candidatus Vecturithrix sp.]
MKIYTAEQIRNVGIIGHGSVGKTSFTEALLFNAKATTRLGRVDDGTTVTDYDDDEKKRKISISAAVACCEWNKYKINILDIPGFADFIVDGQIAMSAADTALVLVCGVSGVEVMTESAWGFAEEYQLPRIIFINKLDRERASFDRTM